MNIRMIIPLMDREAEYRMWKSLLTILLMYLIKNTYTSSKSKLKNQNACIFLSRSILNVFLIRLTVHLFTAINTVEPCRKGREVAIAWGLHFKRNEIALIIIFNKLEVFHKDRSKHQKKVKFNLNLKLI